ncbi:hypothetical protein JB92DRAFT_2793512, partial [Gautieria morchelliformis]
MAGLANLGIVANVIAVLQLTVSNIGVCSEYVAGVKNAHRDRDRIKTELVGLCTVLTQVLQLANEETGRSSQLEPGRASRLSALNERLHVCGVEMRRLRTVLSDESENCEMGDLEARLDGNIEAALDREIEGLGKDLGRNGGMQALTWPLKEADVNKTVDRVRKLKDSLIVAMEVDQTRLTLKIDSGVTALQARTAEISEAMEQAKLQKHCQKIYDWLAAPDHRSKHRDARSVHQETTGLWFVEGEYFQEWREASHSFLWLHGIPGAGKTILCSTIVEDLSLHCRSDLSLAIAFFYFDFNNKDTLPNAVLRSLIEQLSGQCASIPHALESLFSKHEQASAHQHLGQEDLMSTLKTIIKSFQAVYIVFDALDECPERSRFLKVLREVHDWNLDTLHLLATSRKEGDIQKALSGLVSQEVPMYESLVDGDIHVYISRRLVEDVEFRMWSADEKEMVKTTLTQGAQGMFRWVVCQLDALQKCKTPAALKKALMRLPKTLNETYDQILAAIDEDDKQSALSLLQWLAFPCDTLSVDQAMDVIATDPDAIDEPLFDIRRRLRDPRDILAICPSLVTITFQEDHSNKGNTDHHADGVLSTEIGKIRLAHFSVREYLISDYLRMSTSTLSCYYFNEKIAHVFIAKTCLAYLLQFDEDNGVNSNTTKFYPLFGYATYHWMDHARWDPAGDWDDLHGLIMTLLEPMSATYINWMCLYHESDPWLEPRTYPLYIAAEAGLKRACQHLLQTGSDVNAPGGYWGTPLQVAALRGHDAIVQLLLEKGAGVNVQQGRYGSALQVAASRGHDTIVQLLLEKGSDVNAQGGYYGSALEAAVIEGHDMVVQLLLKKGADVNAHGGGCRSVLEGGDVNAQGGRYGSVLEAAVIKGHDTIVQLLLEKGADVNAYGGGRMSAIEAAASRGNDRIVQLILAKGADVNAQGGCYGSALKAAVINGHYMMVRLLLEKGADV